MGENKMPEIVLPAVDPIVTPPVIKPGVQTTEFYTPGLIALVVGIILPVLNKKFNLDLQQTDLVNAVLGITAAVGTIVSWVTYIIGRAKVKSAALTQK